MDMSKERESERAGGRAYKDVPFAVAFVLHLVGVLVVCALYTPLLSAELTDADSDTLLSATQRRAARKAFELAAPYLVFGAIFGAIWAGLWITVVRKFAESLIWVALVTAPLIFVIVLIAAALTGVLALALVGVIGFCLTAAYAFFIIFRQRYRIEFATLTLRTVAGVTTLFPGTLAITFAATLPAFAFQLWWVFTLVSAVFVFVRQADEQRAAAGASPAGAAGSGERFDTGISSAGNACIAYLLFANFWTSQVIQNVVHVTVSGVFGSWYFMNGCVPRAPTLGALRRALTTSFGSICLGSLLVAIVQLVRELIEGARRQQGSLLGALLLCCVSCAVGCVEWLIERFNAFAFVQVAVYGRGFVEAAKATVQLVKSSGATALINWNLTSSAVVLGELVGGVIGAVAVGLASYDQLYSPALEPGAIEEARTLYTALYVVCILFAFACAYAFTAMVSSTVTSGVTTLFVCWAEDPAALFHSNPELHLKFEEITSKFLAELPPGEQQRLHALGGAHARRWTQPPPAPVVRPQELTV